ncbi:hypothetical protein D3C75_258090 [compost metagenome]
MVGGVTGEAGEIFRRDRRVERAPVGVVDAEAILGAELRAQYLVGEVAVDGIAEALELAFIQAVLAAGEAQAVVPIADRTLAAQGDLVGTALVVVQDALVAFAADVFRGERALQVDQLARRLVVEAAHAALGAPPQVVRTGGVFGLFLAVQHVGEQLEVVIHVEGHRRVELATVLAVLQGLVAGAEHRTAGLAGRTVGQHGGAIELAGNVGAVARVHHVQRVGLGVDDGEVVRRQLRGVAVGVVLLGQVTLVAPDRIAAFDLHVDQCIETVVQRREAVCAADAEAAAAAFSGGAATHGQAAAFHVVLQDDVDHAGDRIRTVQGGLATRQDFDALDDVDRNSADVVERVATVVQRRIGHHRAAVDQVLGVTRIQAEHASGFSALGERGGGLAALDAAGGQRRLLQHFGDAVEAA